MSSIGAAQQGRVIRKLSEEFRYYELTYACMHDGGKKIKPREKGARHTSLELLILNYFKNHAEVIKLVRYSAKSRLKAATTR